ncbi:MAG TPA: hypothetical protein VKX16_18535 [Chloroflexota bacterium]|nr:hypothetical protein [Chloroflexota bacterium]
MERHPGRQAGSLHRIWYWAFPCLALLIAIFTLIPAEVWAHPAVDQEYRGFDPNLIYVSSGGGAAVMATRDSVELSAPLGTAPVVTFMTTTLQRVQVGFDVTIVEESGTTLPLRIGVWSPLKATGYFIDFTPAPSRSIAVESITGGSVGKALDGGVVARSAILGTYSAGTKYRVTLLMDRAQGMIAYQVSSHGEVIGRDSVNRQTFPAIFVPVRLALTATSVAGTGSSDVILQNYTLALLHERFWTSRVVDAKAQVILIALAAAALLLVALTVIEGRLSIAGALKRASLAAGGLRPAVLRPGATTVLVLCGVAVYIAGNAFLFRFAGHPFDMGGERIFAYVAHAYGPSQLYYLPNAVTLAPIWGGIPYLEAADPYGPVNTYLFSAIGWLNGILFGGDGPWSSGSLRLEALIKGTNVLFGLGDAVLIYVILGRTRLAHRGRLIGTGLFAFNPAVWFSMSVWGQTHVISVFFVLAAIWFLESGLVAWSWGGLIAACLTRPQMLVFALLVGIVLVRRFGWRTNVGALSRAIVPTYLLLVPLMTATSPSLPVDLVVNNFRVQEAGGNDPSVTTVSQGAYSIWPLVTYVTHGASGLNRIYAPSLAGLIGPLTYQRASQILTFLAMVVVIWALVRLRGVALGSGGYIPAVALGIVAFLMLLTGIVSSHFLLALPFVVLCRRWMDPAVHLVVVGIWSVTTLVPMFGDMGVILSPGNQLLAPAYKPITDFMIRTYAWDRFISAGVIANICALAWLGYVAIRRAMSPSASTRQSHAQ